MGNTIHGKRSGQVAITFDLGLKKSLHIFNIEKSKRIKYIMKQGQTFRRSKAMADKKRARYTNRQMGKNNTPTIG